MTKDLNAKLTDVEAKLRRWQTRLTRAHNAVARYNKMRLRLQGQLASTPAVAKPKVITDSAVPLPELDAFFIPTPKAPDKLDIPPFLKRDVDVDALKAQRKSKEAADKKAMPLTGRAALEAIRPKRKKATG